MSAADERAGDDDPLVELITEEPEWLHALPDLHQVATRAVHLALEAVGLAPESFTVALLACSDERIAALNAEFRGKSAPTNVLSWPSCTLMPDRAGSPPPLPAAGRDGRRAPLGDVAIALQTALRESESGKLPLKNHALHLILHASLHLLGYDHETPEDADLMEGLERRALERVGIPDPYA